MKFKEFMNGIERQSVEAYKKILGPWETLVEEVYCEVTHDIFVLKNPINPDGKNGGEFSTFSEKQHRRLSVPIFSQELKIMGLETIAIKKGCSVEISQSQWFCNFLKTLPENLSVSILEHDIVNYLSGARQLTPFLVIREKRGL